MLFERMDETKPREYPSDQDTVLSRAVAQTGKRPSEQNPAKTKPRKAEMAQLTNIFFPVLALI
jgi:hypothetical protein